MSGGMVPLILHLSINWQGLVSIMPLPPDGNNWNGGPRASLILWRTGKYLSPCRESNQQESRTGVTYFLPNAAGEDFIRCDVSTEIMVHTSVFRVMVSSLGFGGQYYFHLQGRIDCDDSRDIVQSSRRVQMSLWKFVPPCSE